ncbi:ribonuclease P protein subunit p25-like protein [Anopheles marshallii]|uniref:ribonuclease P protein subunit p25-like protein n=1 Tax=Anopheles marshallii TaxID=1521116 RepID=UPI00237B823C|nr:ribonuclease P protein subunit p25-like protein [Anopheles marshallii]
MMHYKKGKNVEEELSQEQIPIEVLPEQFLWMHVKGGSAVTNLVEYAKKTLEEGSHRSVVWSGSDGGVGKTISCAEILKRHFELHQVTRICYRKVEEYWDPQEDGLEQIVAKRNIPCVHILTSLDEIDPTVPGYQHSKTHGGFWTGSGLSSAESPRKRPQGQRPKETGDKKGNYFTGPQLKKKVNRHYSNGDDISGPSNGGNRQQNNSHKGKGTQRPNDAAGDGAGSSRSKGKPRDRDKRRNPNATEVGESGDGTMKKGSEGVGGGRRDRKKSEKEGNQANDVKMDTSADTASRQENPTNEKGHHHGKDNAGGNS